MNPSIIYTFKVKLFFQKKTYRMLEIKSSQTLDDLHLAILDAFGFDNDHLYSFFMDNKRWSREKEYVSPRSEDGNHANRVTLYEFNFQVKQKFLYLFDYGDEWIFEIEYLGAQTANDQGTYPRIVKIQGKSPPQYDDEE